MKDTPQWPISLILLVVVTLFVAGCENRLEENTIPSSQPQNGQSTKTTGTERIVLNWIGHWKGEKARQDLIEAAKKDFEFLHPDVQIHLTYNLDLPGEEKNHKIRAAETIIAMIQSGNIDWDIVYLDISVYEHISERLGDPLWVRDHLVDFATVEGFAETQKDFIISDPKYRQRMGEILTGPYIEGYIQNPWYNAAVAEKVGIVIKEREMHFQDFLEYAKKLHAYNIQNNTSIPFIKLCTWNRLELFFETFFKSLFDNFQAATEEEYNEQKREAFLTTLLAFEELAQYQPIVNDGWQKLAMADYIKNFLLKDDGLFITGGTYMYGHFYSIDPEKSVMLRPAETPVLKKAHGLMADFTPSFAVMKKSPKRKLAEDFLLFLAGPEYAERWVSTTKSPTGIRGHLARFAMEPTDIYEKFAIDMQQKYSSASMVSSRTPTYVFGKNNPVTVNELRLKLAAILEGKLTALEYYENVMQRLQEEAR